MSNLIFTFSLVAPVFLIVFVGIFLKSIKMIDDRFVKTSNALAFNVSLPALVFIKVSATHLNSAINVKIILVAVIGTFITFLLSWAASIFFAKKNADKGAFTQGSFRGNFAIVGLAIIGNLYGQEGIGRASVILAFVLPLYNILAVIALSVPMRKERELNFAKSLLEVIKNPLIIAVILGVPVSYFEIEIPIILLKTGEYLAAMALPLALIGIGGSLNVEQAKKASSMAFASTALKLVIFPALMIYPSSLLGFSAQQIGILFILFGCPTAIASYVMADAMGSNSKLAGNIIVITTILSVFTISIGLFILKEISFI